MIKFFTLFFIISFIPLFKSASQEYNFEKVNIQEDRIKCIYQDHKGILWIGSFDGLIKYFGESYNVYAAKHDDTNSLSHNIVTSICEDRDSNLWIGTRNGLNIFNPKTEKFKTFYKDEKNDGLCHNHIRHLYRDKHGELWIAGKTGLSRIESAGGGNFRFIDYNLGQILNAPDEDISINCFFEPSGGSLYMGTDLYGLCILDRDASGREKFFSCMPENISKITSFLSMEEIEPNIIAIGTPANHFWFFDLEKRQYIENPELASLLKETISPGGIYCMQKDRTGNLWIGTPNSLNIYDTKNPELLYSTDVFKNGGNPELYRDQAYTIFEDKDGIMWISFMCLGLEKYVPKKSVFSRYKTTIKKSEIRRDYIKKIIENDHLLFMATYGDGLLITDKSGNLIKRVNLTDYTKSEISNAINDICFDKKGRIWIATANGLYSYNHSSGRIEHLFFMSSSDKNISSKHIISRVINENDSTIWVVSQEGIRRLNPLQTSFHETKLAGIANSTNPITLFYKDRNGDYWIRHPESLLNYNTEKDTTIKYTPKSFSPIIVASSMCMLHASTGDYWFGTSNAVYMYNKEKNIVKHFYGKDKFMSNYILDIEEDTKGNIWILSNLGLTIYDPEKNEFMKYGKQTGLSERADRIYPGKNNFFYITDEGGFYHFHPDSISLDSLHAPLYFSQLSISGKPVRTSEKPLSGIALQYKKQIELPYSKNSIGFKFNLLDYSSPKEYIYSYRLLGNDSSWIHIGNDNSLNFTGLAPGKYSLAIKAKAPNKIGESISPELSIVIHPPFWKSTWGYILYAFLGVLVFLIYRYQTLKMMRRENFFLMEKMKIEKARELDQLKINFFFNISHEIRTPLTLISGPLSQLSKQNISDEDTQSLNLIQRNVSRLKEIVNQIMDIGKLEMGKYKPKIIRGNPCDLFTDIADSFKPVCKSMGIDFHYNADNFGADCWYSPDACEKIISNLLSNAIKHTDKGGHIGFVCSILKNIHGDAPVDATGKRMICIANNNIVPQSRYLYIVISDTGEGIDTSELSAIFNRFHQAVISKNRKGSGLGLSLTKDLVKQLGGRIYIQSTPNKGTELQVYLPLDKHAFPKNYIEENERDYQHEINRNHVNMLAKTTNKLMEGGKAETDKGERRKLLLVDDNEDLLIFLKGVLAKHYQVMVARNGKEAVHKIHETNVDLVISDIMMPEMDGLEFCQTIKHDIRTSHIPVILLTAKNSEEDEYKGLEIGADDYILKPFSPEVLLLRVSKIIERQEKIREKVNYGLESITVEDKLSDYDNYLLNKILGIIRDNISDSELGPEIICNTIGISQSHLYRKVNALANQSVKELIRNIRLNKAAEILREGNNVSINDLAYSLGFSTPGYFIKMFKKQFGATPKAYDNSYTKDVRRHKDTKN